MKLSYRFFCIAYIIVLLAMGIGGTLIIKNMNDTLWNARIEQTNTAASYATDSFLAFADISYSKITEVQKNDIIHQITNTLDGTIDSVEIYDSDSVGDKYGDLGVNEGLSRFIKEGDSTLLEAVCRVNTGSSDYYLAVYSDFTDIKSQSNFFWKSYAVVVFVISAISGLILFLLTQRVTRPLNELTKITDEIASGNYGQTVDIKSTVYEIKSLSESFNSMSLAVDARIKENRLEIEKRNTFVADFTHELKTPMTAIIGYSQMLNSYALDEAEKKNASLSIYNEARRLESLSLQLLDLFVFQNEEIVLQRVNLYNVGEQLRASLFHLSSRYGVALNINFDNIDIIANEVLLLSLLSNLVDNAFKASTPGDSVEVYCENHLKKIKVYVKDYGRGISKDNINRLTEPFFREDKSRSRKLGGAGLGLSLCKEIADLHGTHLDFKSEIGKGTVVSFELKKECDGND